MGSTLEAEGVMRVRRSDPLLVSLWGKGGVGKSTVAAALALLFSRRGLRVALVSTDVLPSVLDVLGVPGSEAGRWVRACGFEVLAVTEELASRLWRARFGEEVYRLFSTLFDVDRDTLLEYLSEAPWVTEQLHLLLVVEALRGRDVVVWDTAGAGGGLLMLMLEEKLYRHLRLAPRIYSRLRLGGSQSISAIIDSWRGIAEEILTALRSPSHRPILVADVYNPLSILDVRRYVSRVRPPEAVVLNRFSARDACPGCPHTAGHARLSKSALEHLRGLGLPVYTVSERPAPPRGCGALREVAAELEPLAERLLAGERVKNPSRGA